MWHAADARALGLLHTRLRVHAAPCVVVTAAPDVPECLVQAQCPKATTLSLALPLPLLQLTISRTPNLLAKGVLTVTLKKCTNLEASLAALCARAEAAAVAACGAGLMPTARRPSADPERFSRCSPCRTPQTPLR